MSSKKKTAKAGKTRATADSADPPPPSFSIPNSQFSLPQSGLVPKLRFPEFRGTRDWEVKCLSGLIDLISGMHLSPADYSTCGEVPYFTGPSDFTNDLASVTKWTKRSVNVSQADDTLITVKGSGVGEIWYSTLPEVALGRQLMAIRSLDGSSRFMFQFLLKKRSRFEDLGSGNLIPGLSRAVILEMEGCFPTLAEQQKIASCLSSLDELIAAQARKLEALRTHKMQQLFPRDGETTPRLRFPEYQDAGEWEETALGEHFDPVRNGFVGTATPYYTNSDGVRYLQGRNVKEGRIDPSNPIFITKEFHHRQVKSHLKPSDILMVQSGHVGECAVVGDAFAGCNCHALVILSQKASLCPQFFVQYFYSSVGQLAIFQITTGNTIKHILASDLKTLPILVPKPAEQYRIAACFTSLDDLITAQTQKLEALRTHKKALMQQLFPSPQEN
jgi:type I restriction enzyme S subunit